MRLLLLVLCLVEAFAMCEEEPLLQLPQGPLRSTDLLASHLAMNIYRDYRAANAENARKALKRQQAREQEKALDELKARINQRKLRAAEDIRSAVDTYLKFTGEEINKHDLSRHFRNRLNSLIEAYLIGADAVEKYNTAVNIIEVMSEIHEHDSENKIQRKKELKDIAQFMQVHSFSTVLGYVGYFETDNNGNEVYEDEKFHVPTVHDVKPTMRHIKHFAEKEYWHVLNDMYNYLAERINHEEKPSSIPEIQTMTVEEVKRRVQEIYDVLNNLYFSHFQALAEGRHKGFHLSRV